MKKFLFCLGPAVLCIFTAIFAAYGGSSGPNDIFLTVCLGLLAIGAIASGICVGRSVYAKSTLGKAWKITVSILCGVATAFGYGVFLFGGCCALISAFA